jgi:hypothetical protein
MDQAPGSSYICLAEIRGFEAVRELMLVQIYI